MIDDFVKKMRLYRNLGYDGMTMRCDMHILPQSGNRNDEYSNDTLEDRSRFIRQIYAAVKAEFGADFLAEAEIAWEQPWGYGPNSFGSITSDEVLQFCTWIDSDVDIFQIREHDGTRSHPTGFNFKQGEHPALEFAARMKWNNTCVKGAAICSAQPGRLSRIRNMEERYRKGVGRTLSPA